MSAFLATEGPHLTTCLSGCSLAGSSSASVNVKTPGSTSYMTSADVCAAALNVEPISKAKTYCR